MADQIVYVTEDVLQHFWSNLKVEFLDKKVASVDGMGLSHNDFTDEYKEQITQAVSGIYTHPDSDVSPGTYHSVTVDQQGHVTAGTNPTTLEEYGITSLDATKLTGEVPDASIPSIAWSKITGQPEKFTPDTHTHTKSEITDLEIPESLKNPTALTITVDDGDPVVYDGSEAKELTISTTSGLRAMTNEEVDQMMGIGTD